MTVSLTFSHVHDRIHKFLSPDKADTHQIDKATEAIASGGLFGRGPGEGLLKRSVPDVHTDFAYAGAAEEYGLVLSLTLIALFAFVVIRGLQRAMKLSDPYEQVAAAGLFVLVGQQVCINVAVNLNIIPTKGMTLPFISYGGSSMLAMGLTLGLALALGSGHPLTQMALFFSKAALVTFGGAYAALSYVAQEAVQHWGWLRPGEMLDGLGLAETTPGPLILVLPFVGFLGAFRAPGGFSPLVAGALGGAIATWMTFAPCFLWIFLGAPFVERLRGWPALAGALSAIGAAVVGVILNLAVWFATHALFARQIAVTAYGLHFDAPDLASANPVGLALAALALLAVFVGRIGAGWVLAACAAAGLALYPLGLAG